MKNKIIYITFCIMSSCSFFKVDKLTKSDLIIDSVPQDAHAYINDKLIGSTPINLKREDILKNSNDKIIKVLLKRPGYLEREIILNTNGLTKIKTNLTKLDNQYIKDMMKGPIIPFVNDVTSKTMEIQREIVSKNFTQAKRQLKDLEKEYPNLATVYILNGVIEVMKNKKTEAKAYFNKAIMLDRNNKIAKLYLDYLGKI